MVATGVTRAIERAGIPITGVSIGRVDDRATWRCDFQPQATVAQRTQAENLMAAYEVTADTALVQEQADADLARKALTSLARATWESLPVGKPAWVAFLGRWKAIYLNGAA